MSMLKTIQTLPQIRRNAGRFAEIVKILGKYGLASWLSGIEHISKQLRAPDGSAIAILSREERIRAALTELGPAFIKLGQMLSTRSDIVGQDLAEELAKLQADTPPDAPEVVRKTVESELGREIEACFQSFELEPLGSASIGQVHRAVLPNGRGIVVKVQHADIEEKIRNDLEIMIVLADMAEKHDKELSQYQPGRSVREFKRSLLAELDYGRERSNIETFVTNFADDERVRFPGSIPDLCARRVLSMEFLAGIPASKGAELRAQGVDTRAVAQVGADVWIKMILRDGFYHADPHPGNILVQDDGTVGVLDCGMVGFVDGQTRDQFEELVLALLSKDGRELSRQILGICGSPPGLDRSAFRTDVDAFCAEYLTRSFEDVDIEAAAQAAMELIRNHRLTLPSSLAQLIKTLAVLEGTSRKLDRTFNLFELLEPYKKEIIKKRLSPGAVGRRLLTAARDYERLFRTLPQDLGDIMERVRSGTFDVNLKHRDLDAVVNRMVYGIVTSALFLGSTLLLSQRVPPLIGDVSVFGLAGALLSVWLGFRLLRAIARHGKLGE